MVAKEVGIQTKNMICSQPESSGFVPKPNYTLAMALFQHKNLQI